MLSGDRTALAALSHSKDHLFSAVYAKTLYSAQNLRQCARQEACTGISAATLTHQEDNVLTAL